LLHFCSSSCAEIADFTEGSDFPCGVGMRVGVALMAAFILASAGCGHHRASSPTTSAKPEFPPLATAARTPITADVSALPTEPKSTPPTRPAEYRTLTAAECRSRAVKNAPFADELDARPENASHPHPWVRRLKGEPTDSEAGRKVRGYLADEFRNQAAGDAMDKYFELARAEGQFDLLAKSLAELKARLADAEDAERRGLADRAGIDLLRVQVFDLEAKIAELEAGIDSLNVALRAMLGLDPADPLPIRPDDPLRVRPDDVDLDEAVRTGLYYRSDLNLLRTLLSDGGEAADDLADALLKQVSPMLARMKNNPLVSVLVSKRHDTDRSGTQSALNEMLEARTRKAEAEIRAAALDLRGQRLATTAKAAEVRRQQATLTELEKRFAAGQPVQAELTKAKLDLWKSQGEMLTAAVKWNQADAKLRKAMGLLVRE
jgi:hypothetical protein